MNEPTMRKKKLDTALAVPATRQDEYEYKKKKYVYITILNHHSDSHNF